ncbi:hypothetical protein RFI_08646, partial [Reticulomyxa filosa]
MPSEVQSPKRGEKKGENDVKFYLLLYLKKKGLKNKREQFRRNHQNLYFELLYMTCGEIASVQSPRESINTEESNCRDNHFEQALQAIGKTTQASSYQANVQTSACFERRKLRVFQKF